MADLEKESFIMRSKKFLSLCLFFASIQIYSSAANPDLSFVFAYQATVEFCETVLADSDDALATKLLRSMNDCILFDATQKKQLATAQTNYLFTSTPLGARKITEQNKQLQTRIDQYNADITSLQSSNYTLSATHKKKIADRKRSRDLLQQQLDDDIAAVQNANSLNSATQANMTAANALIAKNALAFEQALEFYIASFGQCYTQAGLAYGSSTIIASKYDQNMPITLKEYNQLLTTLRNAYSQFGSSVTITLPLNNGMVANLKQVADYIKNMPITSYTTYAAYGLAALAGTAAAIGAGTVAYNLTHEKNWNDTQVLYNIGGYMIPQSVKDAAQDAFKKAKAMHKSYTQTIQMIKDAITAAFAFKDQAIAFYKENENIFNEIIQETEILKNKLIDKKSPTDASMITRDILNKLKLLNSYVTTDTPDEIKDTLEMLKRIYDKIDAENKAEIPPADIEKNVDRLLVFLNKAKKADAAFTNLQAQALPIAQALYNHSETVINHQFEFGY